MLAICERDLPVEMTDYTVETVETDLTLLGLVGMIDPPRPEVADAVVQAISAGIRIIMITGDYGLTAEAIARKIGIVKGEECRVVTGIELDQMSGTTSRANSSTTTRSSSPGFRRSTRCGLSRLLRRWARSSRLQATGSTTHPP